MSVSVVIPTYNRASMLSRALYSVYSQTRLPDEVIVVDDGSTDATRELINNYFQDVIYISQQNKGVSAARNLGIRKANSDWIALLDSDDEWMPDKLSRQMELVDGDAEARVIHSNEKWVRNGEHLNQMDKHKKYGGWIFKHCLPLCCISPSSVMMHRTVFEDVGLFDESLPACEDYDLWLRVCARYFVHFIDEPLITKYGGHEDQLSHKHWGMDRFRIVALEKIIKSDLLDSDDKQAAITMLESKIDIYSGGARKRGKWDDASIYQSIKQKIDFPEPPKRK